MAFFSKTINEPNEIKHDRSWVNPLMCQLNHSAERYDQEYVYLSLYSLSGCVIECGVKFPEEKAVIDFSKRNQDYGKVQTNFDDDESEMIKFFT
jgi:hypothetical protein